MTTAPYVLLPEWKDRGPVGFSDEDTPLTTFLLQILDLRNRLAPLMNEMNGITPR